MKESGIEPIATKDQPAPGSNANKKPPAYVPFQIPKPGTDQDISNQPEQYNIILD